MRFSGTVIHGDAYGRTLGFPTANIDAADFIAQKIDAEPGIYAGWVQIGGSDEFWRAGIVIMPDTRQTFKLEAHLINFSNDLYESKLTFYPQVFIRKYEVFDTETALREAITNDIAIIKAQELCSPESLK